jgi:hypothetical protein
MTLVVREAKPKQIYYPQVAPYCFKRTVDCRRFIALCKNERNKLSDSDTGQLFGTWYLRLIGSFYHDLPTFRWKNGCPEKLFLPEKFFLKSSTKKMGVLNSSKKLSGTPNRFPSRKVGVLKLDRTPVGLSA